MYLHSRACSACPFTSAPCCRSRGSHQPRLLEQRLPAVARAPTVSTNSSMAACGRTDGALSICPSSRRHIAVALVVQPVMHPVGTVLTSVQVTGEWLHTSSFDSIISMRNCATVILPIAAILPVSQTFNLALALGASIFARIHESVWCLILPPLHVAARFRGWGWLMSTSTSVLTLPLLCCFSFGA